MNPRQPDEFDKIVADLNKRMDAAEDQEQTGLSIREIEDYLAELRGDRQREQEEKETL